MEQKIKHLEMIQSNINRLAQNSFMLKGWALTLVVAMFAFVPKQNVWVFIPIVLASILIFALLDAYYLQLERKYRNLYDMVRQKEESDIDFDLKLNANCSTKESRYIQCIGSKSIWLYYFPIVIIAIGIIIALFV